MPVILLSEPGWRLLRPRFVGPVYRLTSDPPHYKIAAENWLEFEKSVKTAELAAKRVGNWRSFVTAAGRYLAASFAVGNPLRMLEVETALAYIGLTFDDQDVLELAASQDLIDREDVEENVLLNYVFALEALLTGGSNEAISEKIATSAALLIERTTASERRYIEPSKQHTACAAR